MLCFPSLRFVVGVAPVFAALVAVAGCGAVAPDVARPGMVVIPAGHFTMGSTDAQVAAAVRLCARESRSVCEPAQYADEAPRQELASPGYLIDLREVTVADYAACESSGTCTAPGTQPYCNWGVAGRDAHPINCVTWDQARAFCAWNGKRLPTEAEWERAARGDKPRRYPWGSVHPAHQPTLVGNFADLTGVGINPMWDGAVEGYDDGYDGTAPVGSFPGGASPWGLLDAAGNVWEWTADAYVQDVRLATSGSVPSVAMGRVARGGAFASIASDLRTTARYAAPSDAPYNTVGMRCAADPR